eukprot:GILJ01001503.1.p1 GENE.GILJ01001503.1~~GILJ01001503.1.p1  ORF type:complete len:495 (+),score=66.42 GILJ01001503.1:47-1531(+)
MVWLRLCGLLFVMCAMPLLGVVASHAGAKVFALTWNLGSSDSLPDEFIPELSKRLTFAAGLPASMAIGLPGVVALAFQESRAHKQIMDTVVPHFTSTLPYTFCGSIDTDTKAFEDFLRVFGGGSLLKGQTSLYVFVHSGETVDSSEAIRFQCVPGSHGKARIANGKSRASEAGNKGAVAMHVTAQFAGISRKICFVSTHQTYKGDAQSRADAANTILSNKFLKRCHSLVFAGDFNSRFSDVSLEDMETNLLRASTGAMMNFNRKYDELSGQLIHYRRYLHEVNEATIVFPPTYKKATPDECKKLSSLLSEGQALPLSDCLAEAAAEAPIQPLCSALCTQGKIFYLGNEGSAKNRPAYTDRILYKGLYTLAADAESYNSIPTIVWSDHSPVYFKGVLLIVKSTASNHFAVLDTLPAMDAFSADDSGAFELAPVNQAPASLKSPFLQPQPAYRRLPKFYDPAELQTDIESQDDGVGEWSDALTKRQKKHRRKAASH